MCSQQSWVRRKRSSWRPGGTADAWWSAPSHVDVTVRTQRREGLRCPCSAQSARDLPEAATR